MFALLDAMRGQTPAVRHELIIADRLDNELSRRILAEYPEVRLIACAAGTPLPALRAAALAAARGRYVALTEDHCVSATDWLATIAAAFAAAPDDVAAIGGAVSDGLVRNWLDRATFACEYGRYAPPAVTGFADDVPGMNVAHVRRYLQAIPPERLDRGF